MTKPSKHMFEYTAAALSKRAENMSDLARQLGMNRPYLSTRLNQPDAPPMCGDGWPVAAIRRYLHRTAGRVPTIENISARALPWLAVLHAELMAAPKDWLDPHEAALLEALEDVSELYPQLIGYSIADVMEDHVLRDECLSEK